MKDLNLKAKDFENSSKEKERLDEIKKRYRKFISIYPFNNNTRKIESLTPSDVYNPGKDYFLYHIEHKLKDIGHLAIGSAIYAQHAKKNIAKLKSLLKKTVDNSIPISEKVDSDWEAIPWWGGDKHIAKKIIYCYNPEKILPIFNTTHLEHFTTVLELDFNRNASRKYKKSYQDLTLGQKFELLNSLLLNFKNASSKFKKWNNIMFAHFLYYYFPPEGPKTFSARPENKPNKQLLAMSGLLSEPAFEQEVVFLFGILHEQLGFPYIIKIGTLFPDAEVLDKNKEKKLIEFELFASKFDHPHSGCDYIICWDNDLNEKQAKNLPRIIALKEFIEKTQGLNK